MKKITMAVVTSLLLSVSVFAQEKAGKKDTTHHTVMYTCPKHSDVASSEAGKCPKCGMDLHLSAKEEMKAEVAKIYTCPMHPDVSLDKDEKCPKCGMALVEKKSQ
jgi:transcription initiation factor IIE alpha subunit